MKTRHHCGPDCPPQCRLRDGRGDGADIVSLPTVERVPAPVQPQPQPQPGDLRVDIVSTRRPARRPPTNRHRPPTDLPARVPSTISADLAIHHANQLAAAHRHFANAERAYKRASATRAEVVAAAHRDGLGYGWIGKVLGVRRQTVAALVARGGDGGRQNGNDGDTAA